MATGKAYDGEWFERIKRLNARLPSHLRPVSFEEAKQRFISGQDVQPFFDYDRVNKKFIQTQLESLNVLLSDIKNKERNETVLQLYNDKVAEKIRQFEILDLLSDTHVKFDDVQNLFEMVYSRPDRVLFEEVLSRLAWELSGSGSVAGTLAPGLSFICQKVSPQPPEVLSVGVNDYNLDAEIKDVAEIPNYFESALRDAGLHDWSVVIETDHSGKIVVWPMTLKQISLPSLSILQRRHNHSPYTYRKLAGLVAHEIHTHATRAENGRNSSLKLLSIGLSGYQKGEEGIGTYREQVFLGADDYAGFAPCLAIGLGYGLDQGIKRNFREVYELMREYYLVVNGSNQKDSASKAFFQCMNIFSRTDKNGFGPIFTKGLAYRKGNKEIHDLVQKDSRWLEWFDVGKYDPANQEHVKALVDLEILPNESLG